MRHFNYNLAECTWCHKNGGRNRIVDIGQQHNFALSSVLQNMLNTFEACSSTPRKHIFFSTRCLLLADENVQFASRQFILIMQSNNYATSKVFMASY